MWSLTRMESRELLRYLSDKNLLRPEEVVVAAAVVDDEAAGGGVILAPFPKDLGLVWSSLSTLLA